MANTKQNIPAELVLQNSNTVLKQASKLKKQVDDFAFAIERLERSFVMAEMEQKEKERLEGEKNLINSQMSSYVMLDEDELKTLENSEAKKQEPEKAPEKVEKTKVQKASANGVDSNERKPQSQRNQQDRKNRPFEDKQQRPFNKNDKKDGFVKKEKFGNKPFEKDKDEDDDSRKKKPSLSRSAKPKSSDFIPMLEKERVSNYDPNKKSYERRSEDYEKKKKQKIKTNSYILEDDEDGRRRGRKQGNKKKVTPQQLMEPTQIEKAQMTAEIITVRDLSARIGKQANEILKQLLILGVMANINSELDYDTASVVSNELGVELELNIEKTAEEKLFANDVEDSEEDLCERPAVITIMGHVDHGKTSLLDYIRKSHVTSGEAGGITQHIGAYMVDVNGKKITFLDTPGHEAFTSMRARGAQATDIAIIVVAANDGVMPQTIEAINHAKAANVPIIIAINKMDLEVANPDRVKQELTNYELVSEEWGGDTIMVPISAVTGQGVDKLLEMILLVAEMQELKANPNRDARGIIIEAKLDKSRGPLATVLLKTGTLHIGDNIVAGTSSGNVRAMLNDKGENVSTAGPSTPVEISGFDEVPLAGDEMIVVADSRLSKTLIAERKDKEKALKQSAGAKVSLDNLFSQIDQGKQVKLNLIIKADVQGSVEAVRQALERLSNDEVNVRVLHSAVGAVTNDDVNLASAFNAIIIGFNIRPNANAKEIAQKEGVDIRLYRVIYKAIEDIELAMKGLLSPEYQETILGHAQVRDTFRISGVGTIAGCYVTDGKMQRKAQVRLLRDNIVIFEGNLSSLKRFKDDAKEVSTSFECGISLDGFNDIKVNDVIECFIEEEVQR